uniref:Uncharacterized protein n=1 Tax=Candidatus Kentrum sp. DK TaxID=2126562 RepID=A0A450RUW7_9GAMM|nr:MAG: hypothetical protein BECKDK2373B_GA0170837_100348 [Candidatus Kentron sp. DK]
MDFFGDWMPVFIFVSSVVGIGGLIVGVTGLWLNFQARKHTRENQEREHREREKFSEVLQTMTEELKYVHEERKELVKALRKTGKERHQE